MSAVLIPIFWFLLGLVFYTYLGYGILLFFLVRLKRLFKKPKPPGVYTPEVTLVVPCYNEEDFIMQKVENTLALDYPKDKFRIIFITDGSSDGTVDLLRKVEGIELLHEDRRSGKLQRRIEPCNLLKVKWWSSAMPIPC